MGIEQQRHDPTEGYVRTVDELAVADQRAGAEYIRVDADFERRLVDSTLRTAALTRSVDRLNFGVIAFDQCCRILQANAIGRELLAFGTGMRRSATNTLVLHEPAQAELRRHMAEWQPSETWTDRVIRIPRNDGRTALSTVLMAVPPEAESIDQSPGWVLFLFDPTAANDLCPAIIADDLRITYREAQIAAVLAAGESLTVAARRMGIKLHTARSHLRSMFLKVGVRSQGKLMRRILTGPASCLTSSPRAEKAARPSLLKKLLARDSGAGRDVRVRPPTSGQTESDSISCI
jgi:DNA-binding CsgD family transcriptional regulator